MAFAEKQCFVTALHTFKAIIAKIRCIAQKSFLDIVQYSRPCFPGSVHFFKPVVVPPEKIFQTGHIRIIWQIINGICAIVWIFCVEFGVDHTLSIK